jgi:hypothetical protein
MPRIYAHLKAMDVGSERGQEAASTLLSASQAHHSKTRYEPYIF